MAAGGHRLPPIWTGLRPRYRAELRPALLMFRDGRDKSVDVGRVEAAPIETVAFDDLPGPLDSRNIENEHARGHPARDGLFGEADQLAGEVRVSVGAVHASGHDYAVDHEETP